MSTPTQSPFTRYNGILKSLTAVFVALFVLKPIGLPAAEYPQNLSLQHPMPAEADSLGYVQSIFQDSTGFLWVGGRNGLLRYDGYNAKLIDLGDDSEKSIDQVTQLYEDHHKTLWVATRNGLFIYDRDIERIIPIPEDLGVPTLAKKQDIRGLSITQNKLFVASNFEFWIHDLKTKTTIRNVYGKWSDSPVLYKEINKVIQDADNKTWVASNLGVWSIDVHSLEIEVFQAYPQQQLSEKANAVLALSFDQAGNLWMGLKNGLAKLNLNTKALKYYTYNRAELEGIAEGGVQALYHDARGTLWVGYENSGLSAYDNQTDSFHHYRSTPNDAGSLISNSVKAILSDANGDMWIGTYPNGVHYFNWASTAIERYTHNPVNPNSISANSIRAVQQDTKGNLWIGVDGGGINYFDRSTRKITRYKHENQNNNSPSSNSTLSMIIDSHGNLWSGSWAGGLNHLNTNTQKFTRFATEDSEKPPGTSESNSLSGTSPWAIIEDHKNNLWIGTHNGGLSRFNPKTQKFKHWKTALPNQTPTLVSNMIWSLLEDSKGRFWVGTVNGLQLFDRKAETFKNYTSEKADDNRGLLRILCLYEDRLGRVWAGTDGGLTLYNEASDKFIVFNKQDGLVGEVIQSITDDEEGNLWLGTSNGVSHFNPKTKQVSHYAKHQGKSIGEMNSRSITSSAQGEIILGGTKGLWVFKTKKIIDNQRKPPIVFTDFKLFSKSVEVNGEDSLLTKTINNTSRITLDYTQNMFAISFSALNFRQAENNQYRYKLDGFDKQWHDAADARQAVYTNLDAGEYTFKVKASNNDKIWNETPKTVQIIQLPPPWQTWWAYTLYVFIVFCSIWRFVHVQQAKRKMVEEQNRILEIKVAERTTQLRQKNEDIQSMLSNMRQGLFTVTEGGTIHPEYSTYLETIFEKDNLAKQQAAELLFTDSNLGMDALGQIEEALGIMIGEDVINFDFNTHILPTEIQRNINSRKKILSIDWNPILNKNIITKLMITVRDVTRLKEMELEAENQRRELDIIGHLLNVTESKYRIFEESTKKHIDENRLCIEQTPSFNREAVSQLFRNMHTIKGNSRVFKLKYISDMAHHIEDYYSSLSENGEQVWDHQKLLNDLKELEAIFEEYNNIYHRVLSHDENAARYDSDDGVWLENLTVDKMIKCLDTNQITPIKQLLESSRSKSLQLVTCDIVAALPSIAKQLNKPTPHITFEESNLHPKRGIHELLRNTFSHILRNALDHGIESVEHRQAIGKPDIGTINISSHKNASTVNIHISDDGRGINITNLHKMGIQEGIFHPNEKPDDDDIAQLIFRSGVSTKKEVTDISGRGVGMDAVKVFLNQHEGDICIKLDRSQPTADGNILFELIITLPMSYFIEEEQQNKNKVVNIKND